MKYKCTRLSFLCAIFMVCAAATATADEAADKIKIADQALRNGEAALAMRLYGEVLQKPGFAGLPRGRALLNRGLAYEQTGKHVEAVLDFTDAIRLKVFAREDLARAFLDRGVALDELGRADDALADYSAAIALAPEFSAALNNRGNAYRRRGDLQNARHDYEASLVSGNATPEYPLYGLGQIAEAEGNKAAALGFYRQANAVNPQFALAAQRLAVLQSGAGLRGATQPSPVQSLRGPR